jgi:hypothetical protein
MAKKVVRKRNVQKKKASPLIAESPEVIPKDNNSKFNTPQDVILDTIPIEQILKRVGRPTKYDKDVHPLEFIKFSSEGRSLTACAAFMGIHKETVYAWGKDKTKPEFSDAIKVGKVLRLVWWENEGKKGLWAGKSFNAAVYCFSMKNLFTEEYKDRHEVDLGKNTQKTLKLAYSLEDDE